MSNNRPALRKNRFAPTTTATEKSEHDKTYELIGQARILAERTVPSFISGLRCSTVMITSRVPTVGIDQYWRTYWNPRCVDFMVRAAQAVSPQNPCTTCGSSSHHKLSYLTGIWIHEIGHCVFNHQERMEEQGFLNRVKWNVAGDIEMNDDIPGIGKLASEKATKAPLPQMCLPNKMIVDKNDYLAFVLMGSHAFKEATGKDFWDIALPFDVNEIKGDVIEKPFLVFPEAVPTGNPLEYIKLDEGKIAETYYMQIPDPPNQCPICGAEEDDESGEGDEGDEGQQGSGEGDQESQGEGQGDGEGQGQGQKPGKGGGKGHKHGKGGHKCNHGRGTPGQDELSDHGSGAGGEQRPWEDGEPGKGKNAPGVNKHEAKAVRRDIATKIKNSSDGQGTLPAGWQVWADTELQPPKVRWQDKLSAAARAAINRIRGDRFTTFRRLSRTSIVNDCKVVKPSTFEVVPTVIILLDTSGSMGAGRRSRLERGLSECEAILKMHKVKAYFMDGDANIYGGPQEVRSVRSAQVHGGGGTDMDLCVRAALSQKIKPDLLLLLTDGDTPWPAPEVVRKVRMITGIVHESGTNGCPEYMNPIWIDTDE